MRALLPVLLITLAIVGCAHAQACVSSLNVPLRISVCSSNLGTVNLQVRPDGRLQINISLAANVASTFRQVRYSISSGTPDSDLDDFSTSSNLNFSPSQVVCGLTRRVAIAVQLRNADGDNFVAWAVPGDVALPSGVQFSRFRNSGFSGFFTIRFCDCQTSCCGNPGSFTFNCNALRFCPLSAPFTDPASGRRCYCGNVFGGGVACLADRGSCTGVTTCTKNSECPSGSACQLNSCCDGRSICVQLCKSAFPSSPTCTQPALPPGPPGPPQCCNATGFTFSCGSLRFCPQTNPVTGQQCYCGNIQGGVACLADRGTCAGAQACTRNADCPSGSACQLSSCCGGNICVRLCDSQFPSSTPCVQPPTPPTCCPAGFTFRCPACTPAAGAQCPPTGPLSTCPRTSTQAGCYCANVVEGGVTCLADRGTCNDATVCTASSQCPAGSVCQRQSCCGGRNICVQRCSTRFPGAVECQASPAS